MANDTNSVRFGPPNGIDSMDYVLHMAPINDVTGTPENLIGHSLEAPNVNFTDSITETTVRLSNGRIIPVARVKRSPVETNRTMTIGIPSALWTPLLQRTQNNQCKSTFFLVYICPEDEIYNHWEVIPEGTLNPAVAATALITIEDGEMITHTTDLDAPMQIRGWALGFEPIHTVAATQLNTVAFNNDECNGCDGLYGFEMTIGGGDGTAAPTFLTTEDRFATSTALTHSASAGDFVKSILIEGDLILTSHYDSLTDFAAATGGGLTRSVDRGVTNSAVSGYTHIVSKIFRAKNTLFAVGVTTGGDGVISFSDDDGITWSDVGSAAIPTTDTIVDGAYDESTGKLYFVSAGGVLLTGRKSGSVVSLADVSSNLVGSPASLSSVAVLYAKTVIVGGASAYLAQSVDGGMTFSSITLPTTSNVSAIAGNAWRTVVGAAGALFERTAVTKGRFQAITLENGTTVSGNITDIAMAPDDDFNRFAAVTDAGQTIMGKPFYPNA